MAVRAKMTCTQIDGDVVRFRCEYDPKNTPEDNSFSKYTPYGEASYGITNQAAKDQFTVGEKYYFDITPVTQEVTA